MVHMSRYIFIAKIYNPPFTSCVSPLGRVAGRGLSLRLMGQRELVLGNLLTSSLLRLTEGRLGGD